VSDIQQELSNHGMETFILEQGASIVGVADTAYIKNYTSEYNDIISIYPRALSIGVRLSDQIMDKVINGPIKEYEVHYTEVNKQLDNISEKVATFLTSHGYKALRIPASFIEDYHSLQGRFPHKAIAVLSGLGWIGRSDLLITKDFGPRIRFATVFTNAPIEAGQPTRTSECGECQVCVKACPANAIKGTKWSLGIKRKELYDAKACYKHLLHYKKQLGDLICGICVGVCPYGSVKIIRMIE
jgi:epoxyqueuosine reductase QueG